MGKLSNLQVAYLLIAALSLLEACGGGSASSENASTGESSNLSIANTPPTISGNPPLAVKLENSYCFRPTASDADGDLLTFTIKNLPAWAEFNSSLGTLSGQPLVGDEGVYSGIVISVSDGQSANSLSAFSVTVTQTALGSVTLSWDAPTQNTDGSQLLDLAGYKIYYGQCSRTYTDSVEIDNPGLTTFVVEYLVPGPYFFAVVARNSSGIQSSFSNEAAKIVN